MHQQRRPVLLGLRRPSAGSGRAARGAARRMSCPVPVRSCTGSTRRAPRRSPWRPPGRDRRRWRPPRVPHRRGRSAPRREAARPPARRCPYPAPPARQSHCSATSRRARGRQDGCTVPGILHEVLDELPEASRGRRGRRGCPGWRWRRRPSRAAAPRPSAAHPGQCRRDPRAGARAPDIRICPRQREQPLDYWAHPLRGTQAGFERPPIPGAPLAPERPLARPHDDRQPRAQIVRRAGGEPGLAIEGRLQPVERAVQRARPRGRARIRSRRRRCAARGSRPTWPRPCVRSASSKSSSLSSRLRLPPTTR